MQDDHVEAAGSDYRMNDDASVRVKTFILPFSVYASEEARQDMVDKFDRLTELREMAALPSPDGRHPVTVMREQIDRVLFSPLRDDQRRHYPVKMREETIGGVEVQVFVPEAGVAPEHAERVLINLHGGGFMIGWPLASQIESIPICATGRVKVVSVNYRKFPEAQFPAASEDVAAVYRALLETYAPGRIGIYGGSAGGILAAQAIAWFQAVGLPHPAAIVIWSASDGPEFRGDSAYITPQLGSYVAAPIEDTVIMPYFAGADLLNPLVVPSTSQSALAAFPPTLLATGTRAADMSAMTGLHRKLLNAGVDARLVLWDGLDHTFMYNPGMPESREAYAMTMQFFSEHMARVLE